MLDTIFGYEHFAAAYLAVAFIHAIIFIKVHEGVSSKEEAFWMTVFTMLVFPIVGVVTLYEIVSAILLFVLKPSTRRPKKEAELETNNLLARVKLGVTKRLIKNGKA